MSSRRSLSSCWLSSSGDKIVLDRSASGPEPSDRTNWSFCLCRDETMSIWWGSVKLRGWKGKKRGWWPLLPTCCEMKAWTSSPSGRKSVQLRPESLHKEPTVLWLCTDKRAECQHSPIHLVFLTNEAKLAINQKWNTYYIFVLTLSHSKIIWPKYFSQCNGTKQYFVFIITAGNINVHKINSNNNWSRGVFLPFVCIVSAVFQKLRSRLFPQEAKVSLIHCEQTEMELNQRLLKRFHFLKKINNRNNLYSTWDLLRWGSLHQVNKLQLHYETLQIISSAVSKCASTLIMSEINLGNENRKEKH